MATGLKIPALQNALAALQTERNGKAGEAADAARIAQYSSENRKMNSNSELTGLASRQQAMATSENNNRESHAVNEFGQQGFRTQSLQAQRHQVESQNLAALRSFAEGTAKLAASAAAKVAESVK